MVRSAVAIVFVTSVFSTQFTSQYALESCAYDIAVYYDPPSPQVERLRPALVMIENMFESAQKFGAHSRICPIVITSSNFSQAIRNTLSSHIQVTEAPVPVDLSLKRTSVAGYESRMKAFSWFFETKPKRHTIILDSDVLVINNFEHLFQASWDVGFTVTNVQHALINMGVMAVSFSGHWYAQKFFAEAHEEMIRMSESSCQCIIDQTALERILKYHGCELHPLSRLKAKSRCCTLRSGGLTGSKIILLPWTEWNEIPGRAGSHTKFVHFKGPRKKIMGHWFHRLVRENSTISHLASTKRRRFEIVEAPLSNC